MAIYLGSQKVDTHGLVVDNSAWRMFDGLESYQQRFRGLKMTKVGMFDASKATSFYYAFAVCNRLTEVAQLDTSKATNFQNAFDGDTSLKSIKLSTPNVTTFAYAFRSCYSLVSVDLDFSSATALGGVFENCTALENVKMVPESIKATISFQHSPLISDESIQSIIDGLADLTNQTAQTLTLHTDVKAKLTETQIATITSKNWTLA